MCIELVTSFCKFIVCRCKERQQSNEECTYSAEGDRMFPNKQCSVLPLDVDRRRKNSFKYFVLRIYDDDPIG